MNEEEHKYEIIGKERIGSIYVPVRTTFFAYNRQQARYLANKENISVRKIRELGTRTEQGMEFMRQCLLKK